jgi:hypothetical protein
VTVALLLALACLVYGALMLALVEAGLTVAESQRGNLEHSARGDSGSQERTRA